MVIYIVEIQGIPEINHLTEFKLSETGSLTYCNLRGTAVSGIFPDIKFRLSDGSILSSVETYKVLAGVGILGSIESYVVPEGLVDILNLIGLHQKYLGEFLWKVHVRDTFYCKNGWFKMDGKYSSLIVRVPYGVESKISLLLNKYYILSEREEI